MRIKEKNGLEVGRVALFMAFLCMFLVVISHKVLGMKTLSWVITFVAMLLVITSIYLSAIGGIKK